MVEAPDPMVNATRWARDPADGRVHAVEPVDLVLAEVRGHLEALCGRELPADVEPENGPSGALCLPCVIGATADVPDPGRMGTAL